MWCFIRRLFSGKRAIFFSCKVMQNRNYISHQPLCAHHPRRVERKWWMPGKAAGIRKVWMSFNSDAWTDFGFTASGNENGGKVTDRQETTWGRRRCKKQQKKGVWRRSPQTKHADKTQKTFSSERLLLFWTAVCRDDVAFRRFVGRVLLQRCQNINSSLRFHLNGSCLKAPTDSSALTLSFNRPARCSAVLQNIFF